MPFLAQLPSPEFRIVKFADVAKQFTSRANPVASDSATYIGLDNMDSRRAMVSNWGIDIEMIGTKFKIIKGDILLARRNPHLRRVQVAPHSGLFSAHGMVLRSNSDALLQEYLFVYLSSADFWEKANRIAVGSLSKTINWKELAEIEIPLPSLGFQKAISELFFQIEESIVKLDALELSLKQLRRAYSHQWWLNSPKVELGLVGEIITGTTPSTKNSSYWSPEEVAFLTPGDFTGLEISNTSRFVSKSALKVGRPVTKGCVAVVCIGATLGKVARFRIGGLTNQQITCVDGLSESDSLLVTTLLAADEGQAELWKYAAASTVPQLNKSSFEKIQIPWPDVQTRIEWSRYSEEIGTTIAATSKEKESLEAIRDFVGSLTVGVANV